jgi:hypothetical protein
MHAHLSCACVCSWADTTDKVLIFKILLVKPSCSSDLARILTPFGAGERTSWASPTHVHVQCASLLLRCGPVVGWVVGTKACVAVSSRTIVQKHQTFCPKPELHWAPRVGVLWGLYAWDPVRWHIELQCWACGQGSTTQSTTAHFSPSSTLSWPQMPCTLFVKLNSWASQSWGISSKNWVCKLFH